ARPRQGRRRTVNWMQGRCGLPVAEDSPFICTQSAGHAGPHETYLVAMDPDEENLLQRQREALEAARDLILRCMDLPHAANCAWLDQVRECNCHRRLAFKLLPQID